MRYVTYTPGEKQIMAEFGTEQVGAAFGLSIFVFGYGTGSMILPPMSDTPFWEELTYMSFLYFYSSFFKSPLHW